MTDNQRDWVEEKAEQVHTTLQKFPKWGGRQKIVIAAALREAYTNGKLDGDYAATEKVKAAYEKGRLDQKKIDAEFLMSIGYPISQRDDTIGSGTSPKERT